MRCLSGKMQFMDLFMVARQLRVGLESMPEIYRGKCVGDSPELCRILDSHGFSDLENSISHHVALSSFLPFDDTRRFNLGTPKEVMRTMKRCWEIAPSSEQIVAYAKRYSEILKLIVEADGVMIPGEALRSGRRLALHNGKAGNLKTISLNLKMDLSRLKTLLKSFSVSKMNPTRGKRTRKLQKP